MGAAGFNVAWAPAVAAGVGGRAAASARPAGAPVGAVMQDADPGSFARVLRAATVGQGGIRAEEGGPEVASVPDGGPGGDTGAVSDADPPWDGGVTSLAEVAAPAALLLASAAAMSPTAAAVVSPRSVDGGAAGGAAPGSEVLLPGASWLQQANLAAGQPGWALPGSDTAAAVNGPGASAPADSSGPGELPPGGRGAVPGVEAAVALKAGVKATSGQPAHAAAVRVDRPPAGTLGAGLSQGLPTAGFAATQPGAAGGSRMSGTAAGAGTGPHATLALDRFLPGRSVEAPASKPDGRPLGSDALRWGLGRDGLDAALTVGGDGSSAGVHPVVSRDPAPQANAGAWPWRFDAAGLNHGAAPSPHAVAAGGAASAAPGVSEGLAGGQQAEPPDPPTAALTGSTAAARIPGRLPSSGHLMQGGGPDPGPELLNHGSARAHAPADGPNGSPAVAYAAYAPAPGRPSAASSARHAAGPATGATHAAEPATWGDGQAGETGDVAGSGPVAPRGVARADGRREASGGGSVGDAGARVAGDAAPSSRSEGTRGDAHGGQGSGGREPDAPHASDLRLAGLGAMVDAAGSPGAELSIREAARLAASQVSRWIQQAASGAPADRVSVLAARIREDGGEVRLQLHPPHLGELRVELSAEGSRLVVHVAVQHQETGQLLRQHLSLLEQALERAGLQLSGFSVEVGQHPAGGRPDTLAWLQSVPAWGGFGHRDDGVETASVAAVQTRPLWIRLGLAAVDVRV